MVRRRAVQISFRVTDDEMQIITENAKNAGYKTAGSYVRDVALKKRISSPKIDLAGAREIAAEIRHIGSNINQIARKMNMSINVNPQDVEALQKSMKELLEWLTSK